MSTTLRTAALLGIAATLAATAVAKEPAPAAEPEAAAKLTPADLEAAEAKVFSQFGEDGVIAKLFEAIPPTHEFAVEFGAYDGVTNCNVRNLIVNEGWSAVLLEGNPVLARKAIRTYRANPRVKAAQAWVYPGNIELLFEDHGVPKDLDLLVIDIDSNDYYVWRAIHDFRPKVVLTEVNPHYPPPQKMRIAFHPMNYWDGDMYIGASLTTLDAMAKKKGYELVYCMKLGPNCFWVDRQYFDRLAIGDNSPEKLFKAWYAPKGPLEYDPEDTLDWKAFKIPKKLLFDR